METDEELVSSLFASQCQVLSAAAAKPEAAPASPPPRCISSVLLPGFLNILARRIKMVHFQTDKALGSSIYLSICFEAITDTEVLKCNSVVGSAKQNWIPSFDSAVCPSTESTHPLINVLYHLGKCFDFFYKMLAHQSS